MFTQILDPTESPFITWLVALVPVAVLLVLLAVFRVSAWLATLIGSIVTFLLAAWVWHMPLGDGVVAYLYGSASGIWNVDWITLWGVMLFNTLVVTGVFETFRRWLIAQGLGGILDRPGPGHRCRLPVGAVLGRHRDHGVLDRGGRAPLARRPQIRPQ